MTAVDVTLLMVAGIIAGVANTVAGGGSLLAVPMLIFIGVPATVANGTTRPGIVLQCLFAGWGFWKRGAFGQGADRRRGLLHVACGIPGAAAGAFWATRVDDHLFQNILAAVMIAILVLTWMRRGGGRTTGRTTLGAAAAAFLFALAGVYGGFIQAGVGFILMAIWMNGTDWSLARINAWKMALVGAYTVFAVVVFAVEDKIVWGPAIVLMVAQALGGWLGSKLVLRVGDVVLMRMYAVLLIVFAIALFVS